MDLSIFSDNISHDGALFILVFAAAIVFAAITTINKPIMKGVLLALGALLVSVAIYATYEASKEISPKQYQIVLNNLDSSEEARRLIRTEGKIDKRQYGSLLESAGKRAEYEQKIKSYTALQNGANASVKDKNMAIMDGEKNLRLTLDAPGCIAKAPDGIKPFKLKADGGDGEVILIPKGATFTSECFEGI